jgi:hypothetical protein
MDESRYGIWEVNMVSRDSVGRKKFWALKGFWRDVRGNEELVQREVISRGKGGLVCLGGD